MLKYKGQSEKFNQIKDRFVHGDISVNQLGDYLTSGIITDDEYEVILHKRGNKRRKK